MKAFSLLLCSLLFLLTGCAEHAKHGKSTLKVIATAIPHAEILEQVKPMLKDENIDLEIIVVDDFNIPNRALNDREVDANYFQHLPFLHEQEKDFGYTLEPLAPVHIEPMGIYSLRYDSLGDFRTGATIAIPSDPSNEARALALLEKEGLITLKKKDATASVLDILQNPRKLKFIEIDSPLLARTLKDVDAAAINTNFALQAGLSPQKDALAIEDAQSRFVNYVVVFQGDSQREDLQALKKALRSDKVREFIENHYKGAVLPAS